MSGQEPVSLTLGEVEYNFKFTLPRLRELTEKTGKGTRALMFEAAQLNYLSLEWLLWAGLAHPGNPEIKDLKPEKVRGLYELADTDSVIKAFNAAFEGQFARRNGNPQEPADPTG